MEKHFGVRVELDPNGSRRQMFSSYAGMARFVYNWALGVWNEHYETVVVPAKAAGEPYESMGYVKLSKLWNERKNDVAPWHAEVSSQAPTQALIDLNRAFTAFFAGLSGQGPRVEHPRFHAKGRDVESFRLQYPKIDGNHVTLPRIGRVRLREDPTERIAGGKLLNATVVQEADRWFVSLCVVVDVLDIQPKQRPDQPVLDVIGADLGVTPENYLVCSDGKVITAPLPLRKELATIERQSRVVSRRRDARAGIEGHRTMRRKNRKERDAGRPSHHPSKAEKRDRAREIEERKDRQLAAAQAAAKERGDRWTPRRWEDLKSGRQRDAETTLARTNARAKNKRGNATHETTTRLATKHDIVVIEKLHVKGMMQFGHLGRSIADVCPGEFRRQMVYKGAWKGTTVILAPTNFPSTQKCSRCGYVRKGAEKLALRERTYTCPRCGLVIGRDLNSARNLEHYGRREMASRREEAVSRAIGKWWNGPGPSADPGLAQDSLNREARRPAEADRPAADLVGAITR